MQINFDNIQYLTGSKAVIDSMKMVKRLPPFSEEVLAFLTAYSIALQADAEAKAYSDLQTFAFWCRKASLQRMKQNYTDLDNRMGRGVSFHIAPSNIPVMFLFSMGVSLLAGNANVLRISRKETGQCQAAVRVLNQVLEQGQDEMKRYICIIRYPHDAEITEGLSGRCDTRIIWGGNSTITEIRKAPLLPYAVELPFYDRFSICMIQAEEYLKSDKKERLAESFYNDTYFTDQNACTSPHVILWFGNEREKAKELFFKQLQVIVDERYGFQDVQAVDKRMALARLAIRHRGVTLRKGKMNLCRVELPALYSDLKDFRCPGGYFFEYDADRIEDIEPLCNTECQTIVQYGFDRESILSVVKRLQFKGVDRIVEIGQTMDFGLEWDGFDFIYSLTKKIS